MKQLILIVCLFSTVSIAYGQVRVGLSYQHTGQKRNYYADNKQSGTIQANVIWQFLPYFSAFTGLGYNSKNLSLNTVDYDSDEHPERHIGFCPVGVPDEYFEEIFSSTVYCMEIPLGIRINTPSFFNFEMGLSVGMSSIMTTSEASTTSTRSNSFSSRIDAALDIQYSLGKAWQISLAGTWSPFDRRTANSFTELLKYGRGTHWIKNRRKGIRLGMLRSF